MKQVRRGGEKGRNSRGLGGGKGTQAKCFERKGRQVKAGEEKSGLLQSKKGELSSGRKLEERRRPNKTEI